VMAHDYALNAHHNPKPSSDMSWSTASAGVTSPIHVNTAGLGTTIHILEGGKYWCVGALINQSQNPSCVCAFDEFDPMKAEESL
jgi:hypothetical protein